MDKTQLGRVSAVRETEAISEAINGLEEFAAAFPESRDEVMDLIEHSANRKKRYGRVLKSVAERIAALEMLEILHSE